MKIDTLAKLGAFSSIMSVGSKYAYWHSYSKGNSQKNYNNKNRNIEYYYDEKGNIRRRKVKKEVKVNESDND